MNVTLTLLKSAFFFLGELSLAKNQEAVLSDLHEKDDNFIKNIALSIRSGILGCDQDVKDIICHIKDIPSRIELQRLFGIAEDVIEVVVDVVEVIEDALDSEYEEDKEELKESTDKDLDSLLAGTVKQVVAKIKEANLSDEEKIELISIEEAGKNRSIVIAAINEA